MNTVHAILGSLLALLASCAGRVDAPVDRAPRPGIKHVVVLDGSEIARLGILIQPAKPQQFTPRVHGYGVVIGLATLAQTDADIQIAKAAVEDSKAAVRRARKLYGSNSTEHNVSQQALDAAEHQAASDKAQLELVDRKEAATFGQNAPWRKPQRDESIFAAFSSGHSVLVQATFSLGVNFNGLPPELTITRLGTQETQQHWTTRTIWSGPADPTIPGRSFFALAEGTALAEGEHVLIYAPTHAAVDGVEIPSNAIVLNEDKSWCYVMTAPGTFRRIPVDLNQQTDSGYFVARGIRPNTPIVVKGAGLLLARELGAATPGQD
jgi:hypothetical protein